MPRDFDTIEVPFAEKGEPELERWDAAAAASGAAQSERVDAIGASSARRPRASSRCPRACYGLPRSFNPVP